MAKILIVDDRAVNRQLLREILKYSHEILEADDGAQALELARAEQPDLVITDILMPTMDGYELVRRLRADALAPSCPIIFYTGHYLEEQARSLAEASGVTEILYKPIEAEKVIETVNAVLARKAAHTAPPSWDSELYREHQRLLTNKLAQQVKALETANDRLSALVDLGLQVASQQSPILVLETVCDALREIVGARCAFIGILDEDRASFRHWVTSGVAADFAPNDVLRFRPAILSDCLANRRTYCFPQEGDPSDKPMLLSNMSVESLLVAPIYSPNSDYGWLFLVDKTDLEGFSDDVSLVSMVAAHTGSLYENRNYAAETHGRKEILEREMVERMRVEQELKDADRRKDEFLAMLAHELRNPLAPIRSSVELLCRRESAKPELQAPYDTIRRQVDHMTRLLDDLLDVSRFTRGKILLNKGTLDLRKVVENGLDATKAAVRAKGHTVAWSLPAAPVWVDGDETRLEQALRNLLDNAVKYTNPGGRIEVELDAAERTSRVEDPTLYTVLRVRDTGIGIAADMQPRLYDLFSQADTSLGRSQGGLGIGLTMVRMIVEMHGGCVDASSKGLGQGSEFEIYLPALIDRADPHRDMSSGAPPAAERRPARLSIVLVDDNVDTANTMCELLEFLGHRASAAYSGAGAIDLVQNTRPDVVLLDIGLPDIDGYEVARRLRADASFSTTLLVALTGYGQEEDRKQALKAGFDRHLTKPVGIEQLEALFEEFVASKSRR